MLLVIWRFSMGERDMGDPSPEELHKKGMKERRLRESLGEFERIVGERFGLDKKNFIYERTGGLKRAKLYKIISIIEGLPLQQKKSSK